MFSLPFGGVMKHKDSATQMTTNLHKNNPAGVKAICQWLLFCVVVSGERRQIVESIYIKSGVTEIWNLAPSSSSSVVTSLNLNWYWHRLRDEKIHKESSAELIASIVCMWKNRNLMFQVALDYTIMVHYSNVCVRGFNWEIIVTRAWTVSFDREQKDSNKGWQRRHRQFTKGIPKGRL